MASIKILNELDALLKTIPDEKFAYGDLNDPDYTERFEDYLKVAQREPQVQQLTQNLLTVLATRTSKEPLRICSIGCGQCDFESKVLVKVMEAYPNAQIEFVGIDINSESCTLAKKSLATIACKTRLVVGDIMKADTESLGKFDFLFLLHVLYYFNDYAPLFERLKPLVNKENGRIEVAMLCSGPKWKLAVLFFEKELHIPFRDASKCLQELQRIGLQCTINQDMPGELEFLQPFVEEKFSSPVGQNVLDFLCQTKLANYPPEVKKLCIAYLMAVFENEDPYNATALITAAVSVY